MHKAIRRILLVVATLLFAAAAPAVVLHAIGYRFVPAGGHPVGVLLVETIPRGATLQVNGAATGTTPQAVSRLPEGPVTVEVARPGYAGWKKDLFIAATRATEARAIRLFAADPEIDTVASDVASFALSPSRRLLAVVDNRSRLHVLGVTGQPARPPIVLPGNSVIEELLWSPDSSAIIIRIGGRYELVAVSSTAAPRSLSLTAASLAWDTRLPGRLLALERGGNLVSYSIATQAVQTLAQNVRLFAPTSRQMVVVTEQNEMVWYSLQGNIEHSRSLEGEGFGIISHLIATPAGHIAIRDEQGQVAAITRQGQVVPVADGAHLAGWSPDGLSLLLQTGSNELAVFNVDNERLLHVPQRELHTIVRLSRPIHHPQWFAGGNHVLFQTDDEIMIAEIDTRDHPAQFQVDATNTGNAHAMVGEDGNVLFYLKLTDGRRLLVARPLVLPADQR